MLHLHINFHGIHPQFGQKRAQVIFLLVDLVKLGLPLLILVVAAAVAMLDLGEDKHVLWRLGRSNSNSRGKGPGITRYGLIVLLTLYCQLVQFLLVLDLLLLVVFDVLVVPVHGELGARWLRG